MVESHLRRCPGCKSIVPSGVPLCPDCGSSLSTSATGSKRNVRTLALLGVLLGVVLLALAARRITSSRGTNTPCLGGQEAKVEWRTTDSKPAFVPAKLFQIAPVGVPYIKLADIRTTGNRTYGDKCDHEWGHIHDPIYFAVRGEGANAYFNNPAQRFTNDQVEVVVTAVLAHAGSISREIKDRYFPAGRALMVARVWPGSAAEAGGLRPADLLAKVKGVALRAGREYELASQPIIENERAEALIIRDGQEVTITIVRQGRDKFGYNYGEVPILEAAP